MSSATITIRPGIGRKINVEIDADRFEKLAADLGLFSEEFLESLDNAEKDFKFGRVKKISSLYELRK